jgi:hypothetical protein
LVLQSVHQLALPPGGAATAIGELGEAAERLLQSFYITEQFGYLWKRRKTLCEKCTSFMYSFTITTSHRSYALPEMQTLSYESEY